MEVEVSLGEDSELNPPSDPYDFKCWIQYFSKISNLNIASMAGSTFEQCISNYKKFLETFPWLYTYWDKFANFIWVGKGELTNAKDIYTTALSKSTLYYSIDMWLCCIKFFKSNLPQTEQEKMRQIYSAALDAVGGHYCSGNLWRLALNFEDENRRSTFSLLAKAITYVTSDLKTFWAELQLILPKTPLSNFQLFLDNKDKTVTELFSLFDTVALQPSQMNEFAQQEATDDAEERSIYIGRLTEIYNNSLAKIASRSIYEENINRHFFHFNAPDEAQISNWERYASFLEEEFKKAPSKENFDDIVLIYERALIPCAFIDTMWIQYANFLEDCSNDSFTDIDEARKVYKRIPFNVIPDAKIIYAEFEEVYSPTENAPSIYSEMAQSDFAEQIIASASYQIRSHSLLNNYSNPNPEFAQSLNDIALEILRNGRDRLLEKGDIDGSSAVAAFLLDAFGELSDKISGAIYVLKWAQTYANSDPDATSNYLYEAIYNAPSLYEDKLELLKIYIEFMRRHGSKASFQLQLEGEYIRMKNKFIWNKDYFNQKFILSKQGPEQKMKDWIYYSKEIK